LNLNVKLLRSQDKQIVDASLTMLLDRHLDDFQVFWKPRLSFSEEEDSHWDWNTKHKATASCLNYEKFALECDRVTQGLMMLELDYHRSRIEPGKSIVYIDFLSTAPWNRRSIQDPPIYKGVGSVFVQFAIMRSHELEYHGRVGLHALPDAVAFYTKLGMKNFGPDSEKQNLPYFELSREEK
jgi:Acetyltransferase (GNAT) domain